MSMFAFEPDLHLTQLVPLFQELTALSPEKLTPKKVKRVIKRHPSVDGKLFAKDQLIKAYRQLTGNHGLPEFNQRIIKALQMKPTRTISGVTPITVLTKPFPCPGKCIFCPNDIRMPKSYLSDEPGAQRAERNYFDPYLQTYNRLQALHNIGHTVEKAELIVLGGTWSFYSEPYQIWFIKECFRALNDFGTDRDDRKNIIQTYQQLETQYQQLKKNALSSDPEMNKAAFAKHQPQGTSLDKSYNQVVSELYVAPEKKAGFDAYQSASWDELLEQQKVNESSQVRSVGLVVETRPDNISEAEVVRIRRLGCTKTQIGIQSLTDSVLTANNRGHQVAATRRAIKLLRQAGFKIHAHWMANLYGSSVQNDIADFAKLFTDPDFMPDELKIYPCSLLESAELMQYYQAGKWRPYTHDELLEVLTSVIQKTPEYCRLTRVIRDIPSTDIVAGNKKTNFRQIAEQELARRGVESSDIRAREVRHHQVDHESIRIETVAYQTSVADELFIQLLAKVETGQEKLAGFVRLSLPSEQNFIPELLPQTAMIRELHVYGQTVGLSQKKSHKAQHRGFGKKLLQAAEQAAKERGFTSLAVISAIGTREYYRQRGFADGELYQYKSLRD